jgi:hypothetical protein
MVSVSLSRRTGNWVTYKTANERTKAISNGRNIPRLAPEISMQLMTIACCALYPKEYLPDLELSEDGKVIDLVGIRESEVLVKRIRSPSS